jgi:hypothetical protein
VELKPFGRLVEVVGLFYQRGVWEISMVWDSARGVRFLKGQEWAPKMMQRLELFFV